MADVAQDHGAVDHGWCGVRARGADAAGYSGGCSGVIGPNAVIQLAAALDAALGQDVTERVFARAEACDLLANPPERMVDETRVKQLYDALDQMLEPAQAMAIAYDSGRRTADYVRQNRIPALARAVIGFLPRVLGARVLLRAIAAHAWTFAGSGVVRAAAGRPILIEITDNPLRTREGCWHRGVIEGLFGALVDRDARVVYRASEPGRRPVCRFEIHFGQD